MPRKRIQNAEHIPFYLQKNEDLNDVRLFLKLIMKEMYKNKPAYLQEWLDRVTPKVEARQ